MNLSEGPPPEERLVRQMLAMMRHRGPDQFGIYLDQAVGLGNARLSIVDLEGGQQPISNEDGSLWIVFNGEVFNHVELRRDLESRGHRFATRTDTEVILHLYEELGAQCVTRLNGQFALALWDQRDRSLLLARDRLGVRPLFYTRCGNRLVFGSEVKALLVCPGVPAEINPRAIEQIFTFWSTLSPATCFRGVVDVPPGHFLRARDGAVQVTPYWRLDFPSARLAGLQGVEAQAAPAASSGSVLSCPGDQETPALVEAFRELLIDAVRIRLRADVPVGAYLSGGLDSSTIAAIVRRLGVSRLDTFSIAFSDPQFDESPFQRRMAQFLGTDHQVVYATHADIGRVFPEVIWHTETPVMRTSPAPMFLLSKLVRSHRYKVVLTGEGADEFLAGYDIFKEATIRRFWARRPDSRWRPRLLERLYPDIGALSAVGAPYLKAFFGAGLEDVEDPFYSHAIRWRNNRRTQRFFSAEFAKRLEAEGRGGTQHPVLPEAFDAWHPLAQAQYLEIAVFMSQYLLSSQGDRPAMAHSIEGRFPFLDVRVVEFCNRLPVRLKLNGLQEKSLLRLAARAWLPDEIWQRGKRPYRAPIHRSFFNGETCEYVRERLGPKAIADVGIFNAKAVEQLVARIDQGKPLGETDDMALVGLLSTQLVHKLFIADFRTAPPLAEADDVKVVNQRGHTVAA